ncbi:MAG: hypothetical protein EAZ99_03695 [Alphaproteobacteria bacterium]|nr:hypothetical protein [Alphaproteobacteria bacterium]TAD91206.1 MAG: hypothetical protein EAZ99_03695 [Alphaproteobacteria bacterium]
MRRRLPSFWLIAVLFAGVAAIAFGAGMSIRDILVGYVGILAAYFLVSRMEGLLDTMPSRQPVVPPRRPEPPDPA